MTGRLEEELKVERKIRTNLITQPKILTDYYNSFMDDTYNTKHNYIYHVITFVDYIKKNYGINFDNHEDIRRIKALHINNYINDYTYKKDHDFKEKNTNTYKANKLSALRNFFDFLLDNDIVEHNPCLKVKMPKDKRIHEIVSLTNEEIQIVKNNILNGVGSLKAVNYQKKLVNRDLSIVSLGITTGLRVSAICNINIQDISFKDNVIKVIEKGNIEKKVYVPANVMEYIKLWLEDRSEILNGDSLDALFISTQKRRISTNAVRNMLKKYTYNIDKNITPHKLRSTAATNLLEQTGDIYLVAEVLGHKNLQNTRRYAKMSNEKKIDAANILGKLM